MIEELLNNLIAIALVLVPIVTGLVEAIKRATKVNKDYLPTVSLLVGILFALLVAIIADQDLAQYTLVGIISGLAASGLYDQGKVTKGVKK